PGCDHQSDGDFETTERVREALDAEDVVQPAHERTVRNQWLNAGGLVAGEFHRPDPDEDRHETEAGQSASDAPYRLCYTGLLFISTRRCRCDCHFRPPCENVNCPLVVKGQEFLHLLIRMNAKRMET